MRCRQAFGGVLSSETRYLVMVTGSRSIVRSSWIPGRQDDYGYESPESGSELGVEFLLFANLDDEIVFEYH